MVWAGCAQEDHGGGETGSSSDGTFWHITSVPNTVGGSIASEDKIASCETVQPSPACPKLSRPSRLRRSHLSALHSKIASVVFGSSTEASARSLSC